jgi:hypothetical protein
MRRSSPLRFVQLNQYQPSLALCLAVAIFAAPRCSAQGRRTVELSSVLGTYRATQTFQAGSCYVGPCAVPPPIHQNAIMLGGRVTRWVNNRIAVEGSLERSSSTAVDNLVAGNVRALVGLARGGRTLWYVACGPALVLHTGTTRIGTVIGTGAHLQIASRLAIRADLEDYWSSVGGIAQWDLFSALGLSVALGGAGSRGGVPSVPER